MRGCTPPHPSWRSPPRSAAASKARAAVAPPSSAPYAAALASILCLPRREVEEFLHGHPSVAEVQAFGVPSRLYGEELAAWVKLR